MSVIGLKIFVHFPIRLGEAMSGDPISDEQSYACPDSQTDPHKLSSAQMFVWTTLETVDNTCIPAVLVSS